MRSARLDIDRRSVLRWRDRSGCVPAGVLAPAAGLGAETAVFVHPGVLVALGSAGGARVGTDFQHALDDGLVSPRPAGPDRARSRTDVGAVQVEPNALDQIGDHGLAETGVGADTAGRGAVTGLLDGADQGVVGVALNMGMAADRLAR